ncbi:MAG: hypothetical protein ACREUT_21880 [Steroidobacteraceae bacterium]
MTLKPPTLLAAYVNPGVILGVILGVAASRPAAAAGPPAPVPVVPDTAQYLLQSQLAIEQARAEAQRAAAQAKVQAELDANQARLEGRLAAERTSAQARLAAANAGTATATAAQLAELSLLAARPAREPLANPNASMKLATITPGLGSYFGTDHGVLVVRAPTHGILKLHDGDVILSIGDRTPASGSQAIRILSSYDRGEKIRLVILREHRRMQITATMPAVKHQH